MFGWLRGHLKALHFSMATMLLTIVARGAGPVASMLPPHGPWSMEGGELMHVRGSLATAGINSTFWGNLTSLSHDGMRPM